LFSLHAVRSVLRDDRQQKVRRASRLDENTIAGGAGLLPLTFRLTGIRVDVEMGEIATRYVEPQPVTTAEQIGDREQLDDNAVYFARHH